MSNNEKTSYAIIPAGLGGDVFVPDASSGNQPYVAPHRPEIRTKSIDKVPERSEIKIKCLGGESLFSDGRSIELEAGTLSAKDGIVTYNPQLFTENGVNFSRFMGLSSPAEHRDLQKVAKLVINSGSKRTLVTSGTKGMSPARARIEGYLAANGVSTMGNVNNLPSKSLEGKYVPLKWLSPDFLDKAPQQKLGERFDIEPEFSTNQALPPLFC